MIQIHYRDKDGATGVINYLSGENTEVSQPSKHKMFGKLIQLDREAKREMLFAKAAAMAGQWAKIFPEDKFTVVEV